MPRTADISRKTAETLVAVSLDIDGTGMAEVNTSLGFLDHMLITLAKHSGFDLRLEAAADTEVDDHHLVEDCVIVLGRALDTALDDRSGITRFGFAYVPLDESLCRAVIDLSGRPWPEISIGFAREKVGEVATENIVHFFRSMAVEGRMALQVDLIRGDNDHHKAESAFKAVARALRVAVALSGDRVPSTKETLQ
ncbi:MAG TPA: imidazoleglycerol-phosphate dehydratase HisB [Acidimicrobiia bacterium]|jgi:imidazoleglycerol phosphate dehydratase HisB|nr:imidazoleglycerol-phosphate dehydratase HisB [Acidimicrobiia bacterium]